MRRSLLCVAIFNLGLFLSAVFPSAVSAQTEELDFGDAPDNPYPTLLGTNGARHTINPSVFMGSLIDAEPDGQPDPTATGDDTSGVADEDGVAFVTPFFWGFPAQVDVNVSTDGWLNVWFDFDGNGSWLDPGEQVFSGTVAAGVNSIPIAVPKTPGVTPVIARFRYALNGPIPVDGPWPDGEVEDYAVEIEAPLDFGDAPDPLYPTLLASNGACHLIDTDVFMGSLIDIEPDGLPDSSATGDDTSGVADEDGVAFVTPFVPGSTAQVDVTVSMNGWLNVWFDFDGNGSWLDAGEQVYSGAVASSGVNSIPIAVPATAVIGATYARFRYALVGPIPVDGLSAGAGGEVEDYEVTIDEPIDFIDFGDAPHPLYPTLLARDGARHTINPGVFMGSLIDAESDGQPDPTATGDDTSGVADEDGVAFVTPFFWGFPAQVDVNVSTNGWLNVWFDFDGNGSWLDPGEQIYSGVVAAGVISIPIAVPETPSGMPVFARFRYALNGPIPVDGPWPDGEVEDYEVEIASPLDFGDAPDPLYPTLLASNGACHLIDPDVFMGSLIDAEPDGLPDPSATGDDTSGVADEGGVAFVTPFVPGSTAQVDVTVSMNGWLNVWFDFDGNGSWLDPGEQVYSGTVASGVNSIPIAVPATAVIGATFARFRYALVGPIPVDGLWAGLGGEVEDYEVVIDELSGGIPGRRGQPKFALYDAVPNPSNPDTRLSFSLPSACHVRLIICDVRGRIVRTLLDEERGPGPDAVVWDGRDDLRRPVASGVYFYRIEAGDLTQVKRMVIAR